MRRPIEQTINGKRVPLAIGCVVIILRSSANCVPVPFDALFGVNRMNIKSSFNLSQSHRIAPRAEESKHVTANEPIPRERFVFVLLILSKCIGRALNINFEQARKKKRNTQMFSVRRIIADASVCALWPSCRQTDNFQDNTHFTVNRSIHKCIYRDFYVP